MTDPTSQLDGRTVIFPRMPTAHARIMAAVFRGIGIDAELTPKPNQRTVQLGLTYSSGDECYPEIITLGGFLRVLVDEGRDPSKVAFFMPTSSGPCRFGQYAEYIRKVLGQNGFDSALVLSSTSSNSYDGIVPGSGDLTRTGWRGFVAADLLTSLLLRVRPYEVVAGSADKAYDTAIEGLCGVMERPGGPRHRLSRISDAVQAGRDLLRSVKTKGGHRPLIGIVGEIFCRNNEFSNLELIRVFERHGAECWISGLTEWVHYVSWEEEKNIARRESLFSLNRAKAIARHKIQRSDQSRLESLFTDDLKGREEPHSIGELISLGEPYLPSEAALGEMILSVSKVVYLCQKGAAGAVDISPFTCMNAIVSEAIYPKIHRDFGGFPIKTFYFDGTQANLDRDVGIFLELARTYDKLREASPHIGGGSMSLVGG